MLLMSKNDNFNFGRDSLMMSDALRGNIPQLENDIPILDPNAGEHIVVIAAKRVYQQSTPVGVAGILREVLFDVEPAIQFRVMLTDALDIIEELGVSFDGFELHHGQRIIPLVGPFMIKSASIKEISPQDQMCTLQLLLKRTSR